MTKIKRQPAILLFFLAAAVLVLATVTDEDAFTDLVSGKGSAETRKNIEAQCQSLRQQLQEANLPTQFLTVDLSLIDPLPNKNIVLEGLTNCLTRSSESTLSVQGDIFSSDYEGKDGNVIIGQLSFFDSTENKVMEINLQWITDQFQASEVDIQNTNQN
jgi:hypothetical protein